MSEDGQQNRPSITRVVVAVGMDELADRLVPVASAVAVKAGVPIELVTVVTKGTDDFPDVRRRALEDLARRHELVEPTVVVLDGWSVPRTLAGYLAGDLSALVCIVSTVHSRLDDLVIGSVTGGVLNAVASPVLVLGHSATGAVDPSSGPVVICTDGSEEAASIIPLARDWIALTGQPAWVVSQLDPDLAVDPSLESRGVRRFADEIGTGTEWEVLRGHDAGGAVARFAAEKRAGLIIMATHGRSAIARAALGSNAMRTVAAATCPVLVQRPPSVPLVEPDDEAEASE